MLWGVGIKADFVSFMFAGCLAWTLAALIVLALGIQIIVIECCEARFIETTITVSRLNDDSKSLYAEEVDNCNQWLELAQKDYLEGGERWSPYPDSVLIFEPIELYTEDK